MGFSSLLRVWGLIPKGLLVGLVACFFAYFTGVSYGRAPYKLAAKVHEARAAVIVNQTNKIRETIRQKGREANETIENDICILSDADARKLSDIQAN